MKIFYKAGDIGQILYVYLNEKELQQGLQDLKIVDDVSYCSHGLTPPTKNIVQKKFLKSREQQNYTNDRIQMIVDQIKVLDMKDKVHKEVIEEVVDFEDWMVDTIHGEGIKLHFGGDKWLQCNNNILLEHPSLFDCQYWIETEKKTSTASSKPLEKAETKEEIVSSSDGEEEAEGSEGSDESWLHEVEKEVSSAADGANKAGDDNLEWLQDVDVDE
jgi:TATA-binding protein-associated factor Taf7